MDGVAVGLRLRLFGSTGLHGLDGEQVSLTAAERRLLAGLGIAAPNPLSQARLFEVVWQTCPSPSTARQSLYNHISRVRRKSDPSVIQGVDGGYRLGSRVSTDVGEFERALGDARAAVTRHDWPTVHELAEYGCALVLGEPLVDLSHDRLASGRRARLNEQHAELLDLRVEVLLECGRPHEAVAELQRLTALTPGHERRWEMLMLALDGAGRRTEALETFHAARRPDRHRRHRAGCVAL